MSKWFVLLALCMLPAVAGAQLITNSAPGTFVDISLTGGTPILNVGDDTSHAIVTTIGNALFPAGNIVIGNNGAVCGGTTTASIGFTNAAIPATGLPLPYGNVNLLPYWDDLFPTVSPATSSSITIWTQEAGGVLVIMWRAENHYNYHTATNIGQDITFEIQVFGSASGCAPMIQYLYPDVVFGNPDPTLDNGGSATIGYATTIPGLSNVQYSFNTQSISSGTVLTITRSFAFDISSPGGPGCVQIFIADCAGATPGYFIPYTFAAGLYPNGWLDGLDITIPDMINIWNAGPPFRGALPVTIGPVCGLPSGLQFWMAAIGLTASSTPNGKYSTQTYVIP